MAVSVRKRSAPARRAQILDAAVKLFAERGFHATTTKEIAREAGVAEGTVFIYFENKPALLLGILDRMRENVLRDAPTDDAPTDLRDFLRAVLRYPLAAPATDDFAIFRVIVSEMMVNAEMRDRYSRQILTPNIAATEGYFRRWAGQHAPALDAELVTHLLSATILGLIVARIAGDAVLIERWEALPDVLADLLVDGLGEGEP